MLLNKKQFILLSVLAFGLVNQYAQTTVDFNQPDNTSLAATINDGQYGSSDVPGLVINFYTANSSAVADGTTLIYGTSPLSGGLFGDNINGDPMFIIKENGGNEFYFKGVYLVEWVGGSYTLKIEGFKDNASRGSVNVSTAGDFEETVGTAELTASVFQDVDEVRITNVSNTFAVSEMFILYDQFVFDDAIPLPIELLDFDATLTQAGNTSLEWQTASEVNNDYFEVQRSISLTEWHAVEQLKGAGTTQQLTSYQTTDPTPPNGTVYYRLKQVDFDGAYSHSPVVSIELTSDYKLALYPNPVIDNLFINGFSTDRARISVRNSIGKTIISKTGFLQNNLDVSALPAGYYVITVQDDNHSSTQGFLKQ